MQNISHEAQQLISYYKKTKLELIEENDIKNDLKKYLRSKKFIRQDRDNSDYEKFKNDNLGVTIYINSNLVTTDCFIKIKFFDNGIMDGYNNNEIDTIKQFIDAIYTETSDPEFRFIIK